MCDCFPPPFFSPSPFALSLGDEPLIHAWLSEFLDRNLLVDKQHTRLILQNN